MSMLVRGLGGYKRGGGVRGLRDWGSWGGDTKALYERRDT